MNTDKHVNVRLPTVECKQETNYCCENEGDTISSVDPSVPLLPPFKCTPVAGGDDYRTIVKGPKQ